jgi:hypothetical protein
MSTQPIKITVSFLDRSYKLTLDPNTIIEDLTNQVGAKFLAKEGRRLELGRFLSDYDIKDGDRIFAVARQKCLICAEMETRNAEYKKKEEKTQQKMAELKELLSSLTPDEFTKLLENNDFLELIGQKLIQEAPPSGLPCKLADESDSAVNALALFEATTGTVGATIETVESNKTSSTPSEHVVVVVSEEDISELYG